MVALLDNAALLAVEQILIGFGVKLCDVLNEFDVGNDANFGRANLYIGHGNLESVMGAEVVEEAVEVGAIAVFNAAENDLARLSFERVGGIFEGAGFFE